MKTKVIGDMIIGKEHFEELRPQPSIQPKYACLLDAYKSYSIKKQEIWCRWINFIDKLADGDGIDLRWHNVGIYTKNSSKYTICFRFNFEGTTYQCLITKEHNYIWEVDDYAIC